ncbi:MAG: hypothetical protein KAI81_09565, partial [Candidatus Marinimicrobia bacterium]|nr:hypothetical protein [Candidatus Neomarinimicrobiota bacterium]
SLIKLFLMLILILPLSAQDARWLMVGSMHNFYQSYGSEPESAYGNEQQWGLRWPAFFYHQDSQAARGFWISTQNFYDPLADATYDYKVAHVGPRGLSDGRDIGETEMMPVPDKFALYARSDGDHPLVYVDGQEASDLASYDQIDAYDDNIPSTRMLKVVINSSIGLQMTRKIYAYDHPDYGNFHINDFTFVNNGIYNKLGAQLDPTTLEGVYFTWQYRNAVSGEGTIIGSSERNFQGRAGWGVVDNMRWGLNTVNDAIGENPDNPTLNAQFTVDQTDPGTGIDIKDDDGKYMRAILSWHGKHSQSTYDNIGSPNVLGWEKDGRLGAYQYTGVVTIHADKSTIDQSDDIYQPSGTQFIESNNSSTSNSDQYSGDKMQTEYETYIASGHPEKGSHAEQVGDGAANSFANDGGYSSLISYGPYSIPPGDSIHIVWAEAMDGLARATNNQQATGDLRKKIGQIWYKSAVDEETQNNILFADGSTGTLKKDNASDYKNAWVYSSRDSLYKTFKKAIDLYRNDGLDLGENIPPPPPSTFSVESQGNRIYLKWNGNAETYSSFEGYRIFRSKGSYQDSVFYLIANLNVSDGNLANEYSDKSAERGQNYYYFISSYDDGSVAGKVMISNPLYTRTNTAATLLKPPYDSMKDIRIVPNPFNIKNSDLNVAGSPYRILFFNLPKKCNINIYTERGDHVKYIAHEASGDNKWDLLTNSRQIVSSGLYIVHFEVPEAIYKNDDMNDELLIPAGSSVIKKLIVIR